ncbi:hypothetical protein LQ327_09710 [Actinomycetospora endophytica]|uniref:Uncharacterized protein n=1 Tax=Actinomycetospora endophytica TaxID=2291215 RepID=A0ABS8P7Z5_9PSEU|nr:hypothetical protein [Actinomycetospora endophytica]MCD2193655.1 hypothetical protein [Actinomycetospora endophytica]
MRIRFTVLDRLQAPPPADLPVPPAPGDTIEHRLGTYVVVGRRWTLADHAHPEVEIVLRARRNPSDRAMPRLRRRS